MKKKNEKFLRQTPYGLQMLEMERRLIQGALDVSDGAWTEAASKLGVSAIFLRRRGTALGMRRMRHYRRGRKSRIKPPALSEGAGTTFP